MLRRIGSKHPQNEEIENSDLQYLRGYILTKLDNTLMAGNPDINLNKVDFKAKFCYTTRKDKRNFVMEVGAQTRNLQI